MRRVLASTAFFCALLLLSLAASPALPAGASGPTQQMSSKDGKEGGDSFVYADFENVQGNRAFSRRGGTVQLTSYHERTTSPLKRLVVLSWYEVNCTVPPRRLNARLPSTFSKSA
jgi:hypothetical protein